MFWFGIYTNHTGKGQYSKIISPVIIYYNIVPSTKFEGEFREYLGYVLIKLKKQFYR